MKIDFHQYNKTLQSLWCFFFTFLQDNEGRMGMLSYWNQPAGGDMERQHREKLIDSLLLSATLWLKFFTVDLKLNFHVIWRIYSSLPQDGDSKHIIKAVLFMPPKSSYSYFINRIQFI